MFRFFLFINLILIHVFCQTTEDNLQFDTDFFTAQSGQQDVTDEQSWSSDPNYDTTQSSNLETTEQPLEINTSQLWEPVTTEESLQSNPESDTTQTWQELTTEDTSEQGNFLTTQPITSSTIPTICNITCPSSITLDMIEEIKKEIMDEVLRNISNELQRLEDLETRISQLSCSNNNNFSAIKLSWLIYENLQIPLTGWLRVFDQPYSHKTRIDDLNQLAGICHNEVLVGATYNGSLLLAAVGPADVLTLNTLWNRSQQFGQVYWYRANGKSFGFSPNSIIRQTSADNEDLESPLRLSWLLDQNMGGYRVGAVRSLADNSFWHKVIYCN